jgi:hypothetical protein
MSSKNRKKDPQENAPVPFNDALKRVWASPPQPKIAKKKKVKKQK